MSILLSLGAVPVTCDALLEFEKPWRSFPSPVVHELVLLSLELAAFAGC